MTKEIELSKGKYALVDDEDYNWLNQWSWWVEKKGYAVRKESWGGRRHRLYLHRELLRVGPHQIIDHINGNRLDNRRVNLRIVSPTINSRNRLLSTRNKTGHNGIYWVQRVKMFEAYITVKRRRVYLGIFKDLEKAIEARKAGERKYWGYTTEDLRKCPLG